MDAPVNPEYIISNVILWIQIVGVFNGSGTYLKYHNLTQLDHRLLIQLVNQPVRQYKFQLQLLLKGT